MMAPGMAHFHVAGTRASNLIRIAALGPAWEESMSPADFILLTNWLDSPCSVQPHPLRDFGSRVSRSEYPCVIGFQWWRPTSMSYDGPFREGKRPSFYPWYHCACCLCNPGITMVACCPAAAEPKFCRSPGHWPCLCQLVDVPPIALTMLAVHGCPVAGYPLLVNPD